MQCKNGGWASFDKDNTKMIFQYIPFADHNAMLDPPTVDITGRMLEMLAQLRLYAAKTRASRRQSSSFSKSRSRTEAGLAAGASTISTGRSWCCAASKPWVSGTMSRPIQQAAEWIRMVQNADGGWGETCGSYDDPNQRGIGPSTPSQTAWAVLGLLAAGDTRPTPSRRAFAGWSNASRRRKLGRSRAADATARAIYTGTGFPRVFYLAYHLYGSISRCWP